MANKSKVNKPTDWTSAMAVMHKPNGDLRICIDLRELNKALKKNTHPVPTINELLPNIANAKFFSKCDVRHGFWHMRLDEASSRLSAFATPFGRYRWLRMPFRISPASAIFQRLLEQQLGGLEGVRNIHDDILVWGEGETYQEATSICFSIPTTK